MSYNKNLAPLGSSGAHTGPIGPIKAPWDSFKAPEECPLRVPQYPKNWPFFVKKYSFKNQCI